MARTMLVSGAVAWLLGGIVGLGLAVLGTDWLSSVLPPLAIDIEALGGALTAMALAMVTIGAAHVVVVAGLRRERQGRRWARSAGVLLASVLAAVLFGLAAAAMSSAAREAGYTLPLVGAALVATAGTVGYALVAARLARELGSESAS
ncbi:MAG: hypothetical protein M3Q38_06260 [Chloroflexota bacterium]|nr:hypothetical protein [Chloroflexota bacterium]